MTRDSASWRIRRGAGRDVEAVGDVRNLPHADDAFDAVCSLGGVLNHVVDPAERERAVGELRQDRALADVSEHFLVVARAPGA